MIFTRPTGIGPGMVVFSMVPNGLLDRYLLGDKI